MYIGKERASVTTAGGETTHYSIGSWGEKSGRTRRGRKKAYSQKGRQVVPWGVHQITHTYGGLKRKTDVRPVIK